MKTDSLFRIVYGVWVGMVIIFLFMLICYSPESEASDLYHVDLTEEQVTMINDCIEVVFNETAEMQNQLRRYGTTVFAVGECVFAVAYPNGTMHEYQQFLSDWAGANLVSVPPQYLSEDYEF